MYICQLVLINKNDWLDHCIRILANEDKPYGVKTVEKLLSFPFEFGTLTI